MRTGVTWIFLAFVFLWSVLNALGTLDFARSLVAQRGNLMRMAIGILASKWCPVVLIIVLLVGFYYVQYGIPSWIWNRDLEVSILKFAYDPVSEELVFGVQYINNGKVKRTVLGVDFVYFSPDTVADEWALRPALPPYEPTRDPDPKYIEANGTLVASYRHHVSKELATEAGYIFGLQIASVGINGTLDYTTIDVMEIPGHPGQIPSSQRWKKRFSLDLPWDRKKLPLR